MKNNKILRMLVLLLSITILLSFALTSCGDKEDVKEPEDNKGENGENGDNVIPEQPKGDLVLTENGEVKFNIVYNQAVASEELKDEINNVVKQFTDKGITVSVKDSEDASAVQDCEILIGSAIGNREGYKVDTIPLGNEGYSVTVKDNKVLICGGSDEYTVSAMKLFFNTTLNISTADVKNLKVNRGLELVKKQEYFVTKISVDDVDLREFDIAYKDGNETEKSVATILQNRIYAISGYYLPIVTNDKAGEHSINIRTLDRAGTAGFEVTVDKGNMYIDCQISLLFEESVNSFMNKYLSLIAEGEISFNKNFEFDKNILFVDYIEYGGAVGDGRTDDFDAIKKTHDRANLTGQTVMGNPGYTFYIGGHEESIVIKTNVVWNGVKFIIDDSKIAPEDVARDVDVFHVAPDLESFEVEGIKPLKPGQENIGVTFDTDVLLHIVNETKHQYIRYGINQNEGNPMQEVIVVHKDGTVDPSTPIMWDYNEVTHATAFPCGEKPITISGGEFTTIANQAPREYTYYARGILIERSNVTFRNMKHYIKEEGENGAPYSGFYYVRYCNNILMEDIVITGHKTYKRELDERNRMGTYELGGGNSNNVTWRNVTQTNDIMDDRYWGVMGTNYCKNLTYDGCVLSRFDAHCGVYNATIKNSELGHQKLNAIGMGTLLLENVKVHSNYLIGLRGDYGSTWQGDLIMKDIYIDNSGYSSRPVTLVTGSWTNHYFGYTCYLPENITIDGIFVEDPTVGVYVLDTFGNTNIEAPEIGGVENKNPHQITKKIYLKNVPQDYNIRVSQNYYIENKVKVLN